MVGILRTLFVVCLKAIHIISSNWNLRLSSRKMHQKYVYKNVHSSSMHKEQTGNSFNALQEQINICIFPPKIMYSNENITKLIV